MVSVVALTILGSSAFGGGNTAKAAVLDLPSNAVVWAANGTTAYYKTRPSYQKTTLNSIDLRSGAATPIDLGAIQLNSDSSQQVEGSRYGFAGSDADPWATSIVYLSDQGGNLRVLMQRDRPPASSCTDGWHLLDLDDQGNVTVLIKALRKISGTRKCRVVARKSSLIQLTPDGARRRLWLPGWLQRRLGIGRLTVAGDTAAFSIRGGTRRGAIARTLILDLRRRRVLQDFRARNPYDAIDFDLGEDGSYALSRLTYPQRRNRRNPRTSLYFAEALNERPKRIWRSSDVAFPTICGSHVMLQTGPADWAWDSLRVSIIDRTGRLAYSHPLLSAQNVGYAMCSDDFAIVDVGRMFEDTSKVGTGINTIDLRSLEN